MAWTTAAKQQSASLFVLLLSAGLLSCTSQGLQCSEGLQGAKGHVAAQVELHQAMHVPKGPHSSRGESCAACTADSVQLVQACIMSE